MPPRSRALTLWVGALIAAATSTGCSCLPFEPAADDGGAEGIDGGGSASATVGPAGGMIEARRVRLSVPPGALDREVTIRITELSEPAPEGVVAYSPVYRFEPEGLEFAVPALVTIEWDEPGAAPALYWTERGSDRFALLAEGPAPAAQVEGRIEHFSKGHAGQNSPCGRDLNKDNDNCGSCGVSCRNSSHVVSCRAGVCVDEGDGNPDSGVDAGADSGPSVPTDAGQDAQATDGGGSEPFDAGQDAQNPSTDAGNDSAVAGDGGPSLDAGRDSGSDSGGPGPIDASSDAAADGGPDPIDAGSDASSDAGSDAGSDASNDGGDAGPSDGHVISIAAGGAHTCALTDTGHTRCWGWGIYGELGYGNTDDLGDDELAVDLDYVNVGGRVVAMSLGVTHTCALLDNAELRCWGRNHYGPLGLGHNQDIGDDELPVGAGSALLSERVVAVAGGGEHTCVIVEGGRVRCFGLGIDGQHGAVHTQPLGDDEPPPMYSVEVGGLASQIVAGRDHSCALLNDASVRCWGRGTHAPLGLGHTENIGDDEAPGIAGFVDVGEPVRSLVAGWYHTCALLDAGRVRCWGYGALGALGYGNTETIGDDETPALVGDVALSGPATQLVAGTYHTCALLEGGHVQCWGRGLFGPLGYGDTETIGDDEAPLSAGLVPVGAEVIQLAAGSYHTCALTRDGDVRCWGQGEYGQLGCAHRRNVGDNETPADMGSCTPPSPRSGCSTNPHACDEDATCTDTDDEGGYRCTCLPGYAGDGVTCSDIDECETNTDTCHGNATCENTLGSYSCTCNAGYTGNGLTCSDIDECETGEAACDPTAQCENSPGSYRCVCGEGYAGDGSFCSDIEECALGLDNCDDHATCLNLEGSFECSCDEGWVGDGVSCAALNECALDIAACAPEATCHDIDEGFYCTCRAGYEGDGFTCVDIDECAIGIATCVDGAVCENLAGAFRCVGGGGGTMCPFGYQAVDGTCVDIDECAADTDTCSANARCENLPGSFACECLIGFEGDGQTCVDINECALGLDNCGSNSDCVNTPGSFECECWVGFAAPLAEPDAPIDCMNVDECALNLDDCDPRAFCEDAEGGFYCTCPPELVGNGQTCSGIDECALEIDTCDVNATCTDQDVGYACRCKAGFEGDGQLCSDIDECALETDECASHALCANTEGSYTCVCESGYLGDGRTCTSIDPIEPVDECALGIDECDVNATCFDLLDGYECACDAGFNGDGRTCVEIDECAAGTHDCDDNARCINLGGAYACECNQGFVGDGVICDDIDECAQGTHDCGPDAICTNTLGGYECECPAGFTGDGTVCVDIDECAAGLCGDGAVCVNQVGGYECYCDDGFVDDGESCVDVDECAEGWDSCDVHATCLNNPGSYTCSCNAGFAGDGITCLDIDECDDGTARCATQAFCTNTEGSYTCTCGPGFEGDGLTCRDLDECALGLDSCDTEALCINSYGSYTCDCFAGYLGDGFTCVDENECLQSGICDPNAQCDNTDGGYSCACLDGYFGDGLTCADLDECSLDRDDCDALATCTNLPGAFSCTCRAGYSGNGRTCVDIDECSDGADDCDPVAMCTNSAGAFSCRCPGGYTGDGRTCVDINECGLGSDECDPAATCDNVPGSYACTCSAGFGGDGRTCVDIATDAQKVAVGGVHNCARMNGDVLRCWGFGDHGQLGYGQGLSDNFRLGDDELPRTAGHVPLGGRVLDVATGGYHTCALLDDGAIKCWGLGESGQLGYGDRNDRGDDETPALLEPVSVGGPVLQLALGHRHTCALLVDGAVRCWGGNDLGQLGYGHTNTVGDDELPSEVGDVPLPGRVVQLVAGGDHTCGLLEAGGVICFGRGQSGELGYAAAENLGDDETLETLAPVALGAEATDLAVGSEHTCALLEGGDVKCWGNGGYGRLGYANTSHIGDNETPASQPSVQVGGSVRRIAAGQYSTCAVLDDGGLRCWGRGHIGQLGSGSTDDIGDNEHPASASEIDLGGPAIDVGVGLMHACAILGDKTVRCFGQGAWGALGYGNTDNVGSAGSPAAVGAVPLHY